MLSSIIIALVSYVLGGISAISVVIYQDSKQKLKSDDEKMIESVITPQFAAELRQAIIARHKELDS